MLTQSTNCLSISTVDDHINDREFMNILPQDTYTRRNKPHQTMKNDASNSLDENNREFGVSVVKNPRETVSVLNSILNPKSKRSIFYRLSHLSSEYRQTRIVPFGTLIIPQYRSRKFRPVVRYG